MSSCVPRSHIFEHLTVPQTSGYPDIREWFKMMRYLADRMHGTVAVNIDGVIGIDLPTQNIFVRPGSVVVFKAESRQVVDVVSTYDYSRVYRSI